MNGQVRKRPLIESTPDGLWCEEGGFHIDPWKPVPRAIVTHAHSDHLTWGCGSYLASDEGRRVMAVRLGSLAGSLETMAFGAMREIGNVRVTLFPAGHVLGSAQVRVQRVASSDDGPAGETWVVSGDYKTERDATCTAFEPVACQVFITESTFGLPIYHWTPQPRVLDEVRAWWLENVAEQRTSVVFVYPLGKAQRLLAGLNGQGGFGPIGVHGAIARLCEAYQESGVSLGAWGSATGEEAKALAGRGLVLAPPSAAGTVWLRKLASAAPGGISTAFASGWMAVRGVRRRRNVDRGFVLSDHADWAGLHGAIEATGAERIGVTHGYASVMVRWLTEKGREAFVVPSRYEGERGDAEGESEVGLEPVAQGPLLHEGDA